MEENKSEEKVEIKEIKIEEEKRKENEIEVKDKIKDALNIGFVDELIKDNQVEFEYKDIKYKIRKPNFGEKKEVYKKRLEKHLELLNEKDENNNFKNKSVKDITVLYKERGTIDLDELTNKYNSLEKKRNDLKLKLGKALKDEKSDNNLEIYKKEIESITLEQQSLSLEKSRYLEISIENQVEVYAYTYLTYLLAETFKDDKWVKVWDNWKDFLKAPENIVNEISWYVVMIAQNEV